jgi:FkbM family methyltransferase
MWKYLDRFFVFILARPRLQKINRYVFLLALKTLGYNNFENARISGEDYLIDRIARTDPVLLIDIGANKGSYTRLLLEKTNSAVISFEPLPAAFHVLSNLQDEFGDRLYLINKGLGGKEETLEFFYGSEDSELAHFGAEVQEIPYVFSQSGNSVFLDVTTLDNYFSNLPKGKFSRIDLIKIDTEGFEFEVLSGSLKTIEEFQPRFIQIEFNLHHLFRGHTLHKIAKLLPDYEIYQLLPFSNGTIKRLSISPESNVFQYSNFVFVLNGYQDVIS